MSDPYRDNFVPDPPARDEQGHFRGCRGGVGCEKTRCRELWPYVQRLRREAKERTP